MKTSPIILCILDGWGLEEDHPHNAITRANTPVWSGLLRDYPHSAIETSGLAVGLPQGQMGNSEVGHMSIGSGRIIMQSLPRIDAAIAEGSLAQNTTLQQALAALKSSGKYLHVLGLLSYGGVHAHHTHIFALCEIAAKAGVPVKLHAFLDGRDTPPQSAAAWLKQAVALCAAQPLIQLASICGRYYAMDRDKRWDRVEKAYNALVNADAVRNDDMLAALAASYAANVHDEFVPPVVAPNYTGMQDGDGFIFANFRADRARQLCDALVNPAFSGFNRARVVQLSYKIGMVEYSDALAAHMRTLFPVEMPKNTLGEVIAARGMKQLRIAETEKYAHVTFFFNGGVEAVFPGEERILVPSPKVPTYDLQPEMSAPEVTEKLVAAIQSGTFDVMVVNFANPDMVGHTGILAAAIKAVETIDTSLGKIRDAVLAKGGALLITADHGNLECMHDEENNAPHTQHTTNLVPLVLVSDKHKAARLHDGRLCDIAPTVLAMLGVAQPVEMTGNNLLS